MFKKQLFHQISIPADVPPKKEHTFCTNYARITKNTDRLFLFAGDQKIEHQNKDFYGPTIHPDANNPEHLFRIATHGTIGAFATHLGLISRYATQFPSLAYIAKLNGKTDIVPLEQSDPVSTQLWQVTDIVNLIQQRNIPLCGVGYTVYLGSTHEATMLAQAAQIIYQAHQHGLVAILWIYPRGKALLQKDTDDLSADATGVATSLGADFVKIKAPQASTPMDAMTKLSQATNAAGSTKVICSGGAQQDPESVLQSVYEQLTKGKSAGCAIGRNIFQRSYPEAVAMTHALAALVYDHASLKEAQALYKKESFVQK